MTETKKQNWFRKHWIISIFLGLIVLGMIFPDTENNSTITGDIVQEEIKQEQKLIEETQESVELIKQEKVPETIQQTFQEQKEKFLVTYVVDGDTLEIETGERVRFVCIDTPERGEPGYSEAKEYLEDLVLNKEVKLVKDISDTDRYDRLLRYIYLTDGSFVNELIVKNGYGKAYLYKPDITLCPQIQEAEDYAKSNDLGIWGEQEIKQEETKIISSDYDCSSNIYNCGDFSTHAEAQSVFNECGGVSNDIHRLDQDKDGIACESLS